MLLHSPPLSFCLHFLFISQPIPIPDLCLSVSLSFSALKKQLTVWRFNPLSRNPIWRSINFLFKLPVSSVQSSPRFNRPLITSRYQKGLAMAVTHQQQPQEGHISGGGQRPIASITKVAENMTSKRLRRPSVRLGEIGDQPAAALAKHGKATNKFSKTRHLTNLGSQEEEQEGGERENLDNLAIGNWKFKGSKSKRPRTNWVSRFDEGGENDVDGKDEFSRDFELDEESPGHSMENERDLNFRVTHNSRARIGDDGVELDGPSDNGGHGARRWERDDGIRVWLNGLGLERYWPVFMIHEVDEEVLPLLTLEDLKDMGINAVGSRRKMFCAIQKLSNVFP